MTLKIGIRKTASKGSESISNARIYVPEYYKIKRASYESVNDVVSHTQRTLDIKGKEIMNANIDFKQRSHKCGLGWNDDTDKKEYSDSGTNTSYYDTGEGLTVIDIDNVNLPKELTTILGELDPTTQTKRGMHYYFIHDADTTYINRAKLGKNKDIDIRSKGGKIFYEYRGKSKNIKYKHESKNVYELSSHPKVEHWLNDVALKHNHTSTNERGDVGQMDKKELKRLVSKIDVMDFKEEFEWKKALASMYHAGGSKAEDIARKWSKGDKDAYTEHGFDDYWYRLEEGDFGESISAGSLYHYAGEEAKDPTECFKEEDGSVKPLTKKEKKKKKKEAKKLLTDFDYYIQIKLNLTYQKET